MNATASAGPSTRNNVTPTTKRRPRTVHNGTPKPLPSGVQEKDQEIPSRRTKPSPSTPPPPPPLKSPKTATLRLNTPNEKTHNKRPKPLPLPPPNISTSPTVIVSPPDEARSAEPSSSNAFPGFDSPGPSNAQQKIGHRRSQSTPHNQTEEGATLRRSLGPGGSFRKKKQQLEISTPYDPVHLTHIHLDPKTGRFTGVPEGWKRYFQNTGITQDEQKKNLYAIAQIIDFYARRPSLQPELPTVPEKDYPSKTASPSGAPVDGVVSLEPSAAVDEISDLSFIPSKTDPFISLYPYSISPARIKLVEKIGAGGFGDVHRAKLSPGVDRNKTTTAQGEVAVKTLRFGAGISVRRAKKRFMREGVVWAGLEHPNILPFIGYHFDEYAVEAWLICTWQPNGNVAHWLAKRPPYLKERLKFIRDTAEALHYLHCQDPPIVHGDVKAANVLVTDDVRAVLCDFGLAKALDGSKGLTTTATLQGSLPWCSPELFDDQGRSPASDVWAWAWLVWEIMTGEVPFSGITNTEALMYRIIIGKLPEPQTQPRFALVQPLAELVCRCWTKDATKRPTINDCLKVLKTHWYADGSLMASTPESSESQPSAAGALLQRIVSARSALLSNFEVHKLLVQQKNAQRRAEEAYETQIKVVQEAAGQKGSDGDATLGLTTRRKEEAPPANLAKIQDQTLSYLRMTPHPTLRQSEDGLKSLMQHMRQYNLTKGEKLMITNLAPTSNVELYTVVEELEDRFPDPVQTEVLLGEVSASLSEAPVEHAEEASGLSGYAGHTDGEDAMGDVDHDDPDYWANTAAETEYFDEPAYGIVDDLQDNGMDED